MITHVYIDAFNLQYGCLQGTPYRWLDIAALARALLPEHEVRRVRYFTAVLAQVGGGDGHDRDRQLAHLRALKTLPEVSIHYGHHLRGTRRMPLANPPPGGPVTVEVLKVEEKGSDVNLATMLLADAFRGEFEQALLVTNDSDLAFPVEVVRQQLGKAVGVAYPCSRPGRVCSSRLRQVATYTREIRETTLAKCRLPGEIRDAHGCVRKPSNW
jgi:hypothetical protein